jgi:hypothetical protein
MYKTSIQLVYSPSAVILQAGVEKGMRFRVTNLSVYEGWGKSNLLPEYTKKPGLRERIEVVLKAYPDVEWLVFHEPEPIIKPAPSTHQDDAVPQSVTPPFSVNADALEGVLRGLMGLGVIVGAILVQTLLVVDPVLVAKVVEPDGTTVYIEVASWLETPSR